MAKLVGYVTNIQGKYFVRDSSGKVHKLSVGDEIYLNQRVFGKDASAAITIEMISNERINLFGVDEYKVGDFEAPEPEPEPKKEAAPEEKVPEQTHSITKDTSTP